MEDFLNSFGKYIKATEFNSFEFWAYPISTLLLIWIISTVGLKIFTKRKTVKTIFVIHSAWICSSLFVATILIGLICYRWSVNYFSEKPLQLSLLISLFISLLIPLLSFISLRSFFTTDNLKEIVTQPKTPNHLDKIISDTKKVYRRKKLCYLMLFAGFLFLLFALNKGQNLISIVYDNSGSMENSNAVQAISETLDNLDKNNEIILATLDGLGENSSGAKNSLNEILAITNFAKLQGGNVVSFTDPVSAKNGLNQLSNPCWGSPICETIWKSFLFIQTTKANNTYKNKIMVIITDGDDNIGNTIPAGRFFFDVEIFSDCFSPNDVFIVDYSAGSANPFLQKFNESGSESFNVSNNKQDYLDALDNALNSFKNNWYLIYWTVIITVIMTLIALLIEPYKIV